MFYFYCPNCKYEEEIEKIPRGAVGNIRDGYGMPIHHFECPQCHNLDAGAMRLREDKTDWPLESQKRYYQGVISYYQNIRGFA